MMIFLIFSNVKLFKYLNVNLNVNLICQINVC